MGNITQNPLRRSRRGTSKFPLPVAGTDYVTVHWENYCSCLERDVHGNCKDYEYVLVLELPRVGQIEHPGFTISYKQYKQPQWLRLSGFPDKDGASQFGRSSHWLSPTLNNFFGQLSEAQGVRRQGDSLQMYPSSPIVHDELAEVASNPTELSLAVADKALLPTPAYQPVITAISTRPTIAASPLNGQSSVSGPSPEDAGLSKVLPESQPRRPNFRSKVAKFQDKANNAAHEMLLRLTSLSQCLFKGQAEAVAMKAAPSASEDTGASSAGVHPTHSPIKSRAPDSDTTQPTANDHDPLLIAVAVTSIGALVSVLLSALVLCLRCRDPRRRAEQAARREERLNRKLFRKAVRRQKWNQFVQRFTRQHKASAEAKAEANAEDLIGASPGIDWNEWTEKRIAALSRSNLGPHSLRDELTAFRSAHRHVDGLGGAEEGWGYSGGESSGNEGLGGDSANEDARETAEERTRRRDKACRRACLRAHRAHRQRQREQAGHGRRYSDANSEKTAPPPYEESEVPVADGMQYVRPAPIDVTPDSSVVATSTHASLVDSDSEIEGSERGPTRREPPAVIVKTEITELRSGQEEL